MTAYQGWTPASRPGIIPLRPLTFGTILGRSFTALRQNPRVLLGFALGVQTGAYLLVLVGIGGVAFASFSRLDTVPAGGDEYDAIMAGSFALTAITGIVLSLAATALGVIVQGIVVTEVAHAVVAEKLTLRALWQEVKPVAWRLIGYTLLLGLAVGLLIGIVGGAIFAIGVAALPVAIVLTILVILAAIPLTLWLSTKLLLVPATIILEQATIGQAIVRAWTLVRGRFWAALGVIVLISLVFGVVSQVVSLPFSFLTSGLSTIITPTGEPQTGTIIALIVGGVLTQVVTLLVQSVALVVQSTATSLIYIDCRMRHEGLDLDLLAYVERRDAGAVGLPDPYRENVGRAIAPRPPAYAGAPYPPPGYPPAYPSGYAPQGYPPAQGYAPQPYPSGYPAPQPHQPASAPQGYPPPPAYAPPPAYTPPPSATPPPIPPAAAPPATPRADQWAAPGKPAEPVDPDSPWTSR